MQCVIKHIQKGDKHQERHSGVTCKVHKLLTKADEKSRSDSQIEQVNSPHRHL